MNQGPQPQLLPGERIVWSGRPSTAVLFTPGDATAIPFSLLWAGFALFWNMMVWPTDAPLLFKLFGLPFLAAGAHMTVGRFLIDKHRRRTTRYYVTNQRILIVQRDGASAKSLDIQRLPSIQLEEEASGRGTISFSTGNPATNWSYWNGFGPMSPMSDPSPRFVGIDRVRDVYQIIRQHAG